MPLNIPVLYGSMREGRKSEPAAKLIHSELEKRGVVSPYVTPEKYRQMKSLERAAPAEWQKIMTEADALVIVSPEYNHGYPGPLKEMLDSLYVEYHHKPVGICGASGFLGGGRMVEQLREVVVELHMVPIREAIYVPIVWEAFNEDGTPKDASMTSKWEPFFTELFWYAEVLKEGREKHPFPTTKA
ncbi:MAG: NAD(P)H-dependent oxidoreductase [Patescibacteria group bacterium]